MVTREPHEVLGRDWVESESHSGWHYETRTGAGVLSSPEGEDDIAQWRHLIRRGSEGLSQQYFATEHPYVVKDSRILGGEPVIVGTRTPVRVIVETWWLGTPPETIPAHLPHLTVAQVFDALSYFSDHQQEILDYINRNRVPDEFVNPLFRYP